MSTASDFATAAQALVATLGDAVPDPGDAIRLLSDLTAYMPIDPAKPAVGVVATQMQTATADLFRRAAVVAMARASALYQPSSYEDAATIRAIVCNALDAETIIAADQGEDGSYAALKALRAAVARDLTERGANLAHMVEVKTPAPQPAIALAHRLYQDLDRAEDLVTRAEPIHPAFMPVNMMALSE